MLRWIVNKKCHTIKMYIILINCLKYLHDSDCGRWSMNPILSYVGPVKLNNAIPLQKVILTNRWTKPITQFRSNLAVEKTVINVYFITTRVLSVLYPIVTTEHC